MLKAQGIARRGLMPGDVLYVYTGWGDFWRDPDTEKFYYTKAPGLSYDAARYIGERRIVAVALDTPFVDPVNDGQLQGKSHSSPHAHADGDPPHRECEPGGDGARQGLDVVHHDSAGAREGERGVGGTARRDRRAAPLTRG